MNGIQAANIARVFCLYISLLTTMAIAMYFGTDYVVLGAGAGVALLTVWQFR